MAYQKKRSTRISACPTIDKLGVLMQWHYTQAGRDRFGGYTKCSFVSLITRPGMPGIWVDAPYHCYAYKHTYRRLPSGLAARVYLCCARGWIGDRIYDLRGQYHRARVRLHLAAHRWSPAQIIARRRSRREWSNFLNDLGRK